LGCAETKLNHEQQLASNNENHHLGKKNQASKVLEA
jgi:hypothetical protein